MVNTVKSMIVKRLWAPAATVVTLASFLVACESADTESDIPDSVVTVEAPVEPAPEIDPLERQTWEVDFERQRVIGDLLYDALRALQQDRLVLPREDNALFRYQRVLALEPDNQLALEGIQNIVGRYLELAATASRQGRFPAAQDFINRARLVDRDSPAIPDAQRALEADRDSGDLVFELDLQQLASESPALIRQLGQIADQAVERQAFVWITAPSDEKGRWIYGTMREQVDGFRLRGNIELGGFAVIRLRLPDPQSVSTATSDREPS